MNLSESLINFALKHATDNVTIVDLRLGLGYSCVELSDGRSGIAWTPNNYQSGSCTYLRKAGEINGLTAIEVVSWLKSENVLERTVALATFNALNSTIEREFLYDEAVSLLKLTKSDHVVMVGYFAPLVPAIKASCCRFEVIELDAEKPGVISPQQGFKALSECDVAIITATSIVNNTVDGLLSSLKRNRAAVMLGPSTPMCPEAFVDTRITQLSGSFVKNIERVKTIVSQGGGTMLLKKHLQFATLIV